MALLGLAPTSAPTAAGTAEALLRCPHPLHVAVAAPGLAQVAAPAAASPALRLARARQRLTRFPHGA